MNTANIKSDDDVLLSIKNNSDLNNYYEYINNDMNLTEINLLITYLNFFYKDDKMYILDKFF